MGILGRIKEIAVADVNSFLDRMEHPASMVKQYIREIEEQVVLAQQSYADQLIAERQVDGLIAEEGRLVLKRTRQAELAVDHGEDGIAGLALQEKLNAEARLSSYQEQKAQLQAQTAALTAELTRLKGLYDALQAKLVVLQARESAARALQNVNRTVRTLDTRAIQQGLARLEGQVWRAEAGAEASRVVNGIFHGGGAAKSPAGAVSWEARQELQHLKEERRAGE